MKIQNVTQLVKEILTRQKLKFRKQLKAICKFGSQKLNTFYILFKHLVFLVTRYIYFLFKQWTTWLFIFLDFLGAAYSLIPIFRQLPQEAYYFIGAVCFIIANNEVIKKKDFSTLTKENNKFIGHTFKVNSLSISKNNQMFVSSSDRVAIVWDILTDKKNVILHRLQCPTWIGNALFVEHDKFVIGIGGKGQFFKWDLSTDDLIQTVPLEKTDSVALAISPSEEFTATSGKDGEIHIWNYPSLNSAFNHQMGKSEVRKIVFSPNGKELAACDVSGKVVLINLETRSSEKLFEHPENEPIRFISFSPTGKEIAFVAGDGKPYLYNRITKKFIYSSNGHSDIGLCCCFSTDGKYLVTGGQDNTIIIWRIHPNKLQKYLQIKGHTDAITSLVFEKKHNNLFSASRDEKIKYWKIEKLLL